MSVREVWFDPGEGGASDVEGGLKAGEEDGMVDGVDDDDFLVLTCLYVLFVSFILFYVIL